MGDLQQRKIAEEDNLGQPSAEEGNLGRPSAEEDNLGQPSAEEANLGQPSDPESPGNTSAACAVCCSVAVNRVATFKELDTDLIRHTGFLSLVRPSLHSPAGYSGSHMMTTGEVLGVGKGKVFPYSLPSVGPGADPGVQAVSPQVT